MNQYWVGEKVRISTDDPNLIGNGGFLDVNNISVDPGIVTLSITVDEKILTNSTYTAGGAITGPYVIVKETTGHYHADVDTTNLPGEWIPVWTGAGTVQAVAPGTFLVNPLPVT